MNREKDNQRASDILIIGKTTVPVLSIMVDGRSMMVELGEWTPGANDMPHCYQGEGW